MTALLAPAVLLARLAALPRDRRRIIAVAGPPGSGKSALAEALAARLPDAAVLPMDGFHYDDAVLEARGWRARKGAPHTFDAGGLAAMLGRLRADREAEIAVPVFDRRLEIARAGARIIPAAARLVIVEGNWLILDRPPWAALRPLLDLAVLLVVPEAELARRLRARWEGLGLDPEAVAAKLEGNDLPNARLVLSESRGAELLIDGTAPLP